MKFLLFLGLLGSATGLKSIAGGTKEIHTDIIVEVYGEGSVTAKGAGKFQIHVTNEKLVESLQKDNFVHTDLFLIATIQASDHQLPEASTRVKLKYWQGDCGTEASITEQLINGSRLNIASKDDVKGGTDTGHALQSCVELMNDDDQGTSFYGDLDVKLEIQIGNLVTLKKYNSTIHHPVDESLFDYDPIIVSNDWILDVDETTTFSGDPMQNDGSNNGIGARDLGHDSDTDKQMKVIVPIISVHGLKVPNVSISHDDFVKGDLRNATATMSIDDNKYEHFKGTKVDKAAVTCTTVVSAPDLTVVCTASTATGGAEFTLPYDHVKQSYVSGTECVSCGGRIEIEATGSGSGGLQGAWVGAGISKWATSDFACAHPSFSRITSVDKDFFDSDQKSLSDILLVENKVRICELGDTLTFVKPSDVYNLVSGCVGGQEIVGKATSRDAGLNFIKNKYNDCKVAEPGEFTDAPIQVGEVVGIQPSCSDGVSVKTACADWRVAVTSNLLYRNTKRLGYVYGVSNTSSGDTMSTKHTPSTSTFFQNQTSRTCTPSESPTNLIVEKQDAFETATSDFVSVGTLGFTLLPTDVKFNNDATTKNKGNTKIQDGKTLRARCGVETAQVALSCILKDRTSISDDGLVEASASVSALATTPDISYDLLKDDAAVGKQNPATSATAYAENGDDRSNATYKKSITYTGFDPQQTYEITLTRDKSVDYEFNCGISGDVETYSGSTDLPCTGTQALQHVVTTWVRYTANDLEVTPAFASGKESINEYTYGDLATKTIVDALEFTSDAIANDIENGKTGSAVEDFSVVLTDAAPPPVAGTMKFAASGCQYDADKIKIKCDLVIEGSRNNIYGGADEEHVLTFAPKYRHHTTDATCASDTPATLADSAVASPQTLTFKFKKEHDLYRGDIYVRDVDNYKNITASSMDEDGWIYIPKEGINDYITTAHVVDISLDTSSIHQKPRIAFEILTDDASPLCSHTDRKILYNPSDVSFEPSSSSTYPEVGSPENVEECIGRVNQFKSDCQSTWGTTQWGTTQYTEIKMKSGEDSLMPTFRVIDDYSIGDAGKTVKTLTFYVQQCDDTTRRKIMINIKGTLMDSDPVVGVMVTNFTDVNLYEYKFQERGQSIITPVRLKAADVDRVYVEWNKVELNFQHFTSGSKVQGPKQFEFNACSPDQTFEPSNSSVIVDRHGSTVTFTKKETCRAFGIIDFKFDGVCYYLQIPCNRHAGGTKILNLALDYGVVFTNDELSVNSDTDKTITLGDTNNARCKTDGTVNTEEDYDTECDFTTTSIATDFKEIVNVFDKCGSNTPTTYGTTWDMKLIQGITKDSQNFCNERLLKLSLIHKGNDTASIMVNSVSKDLEFNLALTNFGYQACEKDGNAWHKIVFNIEGTTDAPVPACTAVDTPYAGCTVPACTAVDTPYAGCTVPACTAVNTPYAGCAVPACTDVATPYDGCAVPICTAVDTPYAGCTAAVTCTGVDTPSGCNVVPACTAVATPYDGCTVPACTAVDTPYAGCTVPACTAADTPYAGCDTASTAAATPYAG